MNSTEFLSAVIAVVIILGSGFLIFKDTESVAEKLSDVEVVEPIPHRDEVFPQPVEKPKFNPHKREFTLDDGTPCVFISVPSYSSRKADASGVSCDWGYQDDHELIF